MAIHFGKLVESIRDKRGISWVEIARLIKYHPNSLPAMRKREHWNTDLLDRVCVALSYNFYLDKSKEIAALIDPSGVSEPMVPYEIDDWKRKYLEIKHATDPLVQEVRLLKSSVEDKNRLIQTQSEMIELLKNKPVVNGN